MNMRLVRQVIAGLIFSGFVFTLSGCATGVLHRTEVRNLEAKLSIGDTRQKVRAVLGEPLLDARSLGLEVYRKTGRDIDYLMVIWPIPWPSPGQKVTVGMLVVYDEHNLVKDIDTISTSNTNVVDEANAGGFMLIAGFDLNHKPLEILYAPVEGSRESLSQAPPPGQCKVFFALTGYSFDTILVDGEKIVDDFGSILRNAEYVDRLFPGHTDNQKRLGFIWKSFPPGTHEVEVRRTRPYNPQPVFHSLHCESAQTRYVHIVDIPLDGKLHAEVNVNFDVEFNVSNELPNTFVGRREIIFTQGTWLGDSN
jgi:hypothetical protein